MPRASPLIQMISNIKGIFSIVGRTRKARKLWLLNYFFSGVFIVWFFGFLVRLHH